MCYSGKCKYEYKNCPNDYVGECMLGSESKPEDAHCVIIEDEIEEYMKKMESDTID